MYCLLIVDDEPHITDGLFDLIQQHYDQELDICKAYSTDEAMSLMLRRRIDILLTDIEMPGMTGLELQHHVMNRWPKCKVVFLTGFINTEYLHTALRQGANDYLLKMENDNEIIATIDKMIHQMNDSFEVDQLLRDAKEQVRWAKSELQKEYLLHLFSGNKSDAEERKVKFNTLNINLDAYAEVVVVIGKIDLWNSEMKVQNEAIVKFIIKNIAEEYLTHKVKMVTFNYGVTDIVWLIQSDKNKDMVDSLTWFIYNSFDLVQNSCRKLFQISLSIVVSSSLITWENVSLKSDKLFHLLNRKFGNGNDMLLWEEVDEYLNEPSLEEVNREHHYLVFNRIHELKTSLETGRKEEFLTLFDHIAESLSVFGNYNRCLEFYYTAATLVASFINRWGVTQGFDSQNSMGRLFKLGGRNWEAEFEFLRQYVIQLFELRSKENDSRNEMIIEKIHHYINNHLSEDLSLTRLSELVMLNPSYLSRLYKQITGEHLSKYVSEQKIERAKFLLWNTDMKVYEISQNTGFSSATYFNNFFKKEIGMTPHEFRIAAK